MRPGSHRPSALGEGFALRDGLPLRERRSVVPSAGFEQSGLVGVDDGVDAVSEGELHEDPLDVGLHGALAEAELPGDHPVGEAVPDVDEHRARGR